MINKPKKKEWNEYAKFTDDKWIAEPKLDGMRCELRNLDQVRLVRENGNDKTMQFPEIIKALGDSLPQDTTLDGEICLLDKVNNLRADFQTLSPRFNLGDQLRIKLLSQRIPATFVAFDIMKFKGENMENKSYEERREALESIKFPELNVSLMPQYKPQDLLPKVEPMELEGIVLKNKYSTYRQDWFKFKYLLEDDFVVVGTTSEKRLISSLVLENMQGEAVGNVNYINYPQTEQMKKQVIGMKAVVRYMKTNGKSLRFPVLQELRAI
jgi:ATP-dependent DNA ligase